MFENQAPAGITRAAGTRQAGDNEKGVPQIEVTPEMIEAFRSWYDEATTLDLVTDVSESSIVADEGTPFVDVLAIDILAATFRIRALERALAPFAAQADEIEKFARECEIEPDGVAMRCPYEACVVARAALSPASTPSAERLFQRNAISST